ncbi:MAG TPA: hypothetical protein VJ201_01340 [Candidatus Babeliales bacterium]|nr:hypothetical protein [Candidatus Babeliales bacterium]
MEAMQQLEKKIICLVEKLKVVQDDNNFLKSENKRLESELKMLEELMQHESASKDEAAKEIVAGLIKHIDSIIESNQ